MFQRKWWPIRFHWYRYSGYGWWHLRYFYYKYTDEYADREQEHEVWISKLCIRFG